MSTQETSRVSYEIAYDKTRQSVIVYPQYRGTRPNHHVIGNFAPENPHDDFETYREDLSEAVVNALARVGELDTDAWSITVTQLNGGPDYHAKQAEAPLAKVPVEDQVAVGSGRTAAEAAEQEQENGEPVPHASQLTQETVRKDLAEAEAAKLDETVPHSGKSTTKKSKKTED